VRIDEVQAGATDENLEVFCTIRNRTNILQLFNGSVIRMAVTDADGIGVFTDYGMYPPSGPLTNIAGNKEMPPGAEMKVRFLFRMPEGVAPLRTLSMWEQYSESRVVDISGVTWGRSKPQADLSKLNLKFGGAEFQAGGDNMDVRFDGFRKARDGAYEAFFTFKNVAEKSDIYSTLDYTSSSVAVELFGNTEKPVHHDYTIYRANGDQAVPMTQHLVIIRGGEARVRYRFKPAAGFTPEKLALTERSSKTTLQWVVK
jgi:hypothetical protein